MVAGEDDPAELLDWDTEFWGKRIGRVRGSTLDRAASIDAWADAHDIDALFFLADAEDPRAAHAAERAGWQMMDIRVELERPADRAPLAEVIREARPDDGAKLVAIASKSHGVTRFYADPKFPDERCDQLYETWIANSLAGWAAGVLVADGDNGPAGYVSCHLDEGTGSIGLIAVDADARRAGLGVALAGSAVAWCAERGAERMTVVTQARNLPALRTFERVGFLVSSVGLWFHKWYR